MSAAALLLASLLPALTGLVLIAATDPHRRAVQRKDAAGIRARRLGIALLGAGGGVALVMAPPALWVMWLGVLTLAGYALAWGFSVVNESDSR